MKIFKILKTVLFVLFGITFINAGLDKFFHYMPLPTMSEEIQKVDAATASLTWIMPLVGIVQVISGISVIFPKTRALGAIMNFPIMVGIICHNATFMPEGLLSVGILFLINVWMIFDDWAKIKSLV